MDGFSVPHQTMTIAAGQTDGDCQGDAVAALRRRILETFADAQDCLAGWQQRRLLTFVVVGGGPAGVALASTVADIARMALACDFNDIDPADVRVIVLEQATSLLPGASGKACTEARKALKRRGVEVRLGARAARIDRRGVALADARIDAATVIWTADSATLPAAHWLHGAWVTRAGLGRGMPPTRELLDAI